LPSDSPPLKHNKSTHQLDAKNLGLLLKELITPTKTKITKNTIKIYKKKGGTLQ
jgi:hypothetical protein